MNDNGIPNWLGWARRLQALSQTGQHFSDNPFDEIRYQEIGQIAEEIIRSYTDLSADTLREQVLSQPGYATPKVAVRGAVFRNGKLLLVKEKMDGCWAMPGGWADVNDPPSKMVEREVWEESGFEVRAKRLIGVYESNHDRQPLNIWHNYKLLFFCELLGGEAKISEETSAVGFFDREALPPLSLFRTNPREVAESFAHYQEPQRPAFFD